jgi:hypothetical protein
MQNLIIILVFEKSANFCQKSQKIVIITSTPGHSAMLQDTFLTINKENYGGRLFTSFVPGYRVAR